MARGLTNKNITPSNISYLIQYGRIGKSTKNGSLCVSKDEVINYFQTQSDKRKQIWQDAQDNNVNWHLSFEKYKEAETTKHVHRLHP